MGEIIISKKEQKLYEQALQLICKKLTIDEFTQLNDKFYRQSQRIVAKMRA